jgi:hypothetical protein
LKKFTAVKVFFIYFGSKIAIYLSLGLHKGHTSYRRREVFSPQKRTSSISKHENSLLFSIFVVIFALLDPDPDPAAQINADPCGSGSGSTTLYSVFPYRLAAGLRSRILYSRMDRFRIRI